MTVLPPPPIAGRLVIDVSHWDGLIDWHLVYDAGIHDAIVKLTDGTAIGDPLGGYNARAAQEAGLSVEYYHFLRPNLDGPEQLRIFKAALYGVRHTSSQKVCLDIEVTGGLLPVYLRTYILGCYKFVLSEFQLVPEIYTRMSFWRQAVGTIDWLGLELPEPPLFTADYGWYGDGRPLTAPRWISGGWRVYRRWQYTDRGIVPGVPSKCDLSVEP